MDVWSLEEDDCNDLFITQTPHCDQDLDNGCSKQSMEVGGDHYSDISDDDLEFNFSQFRSPTTGQPFRYFFLH